MSDDRIEIDGDTWVLVLTGAGVSAESGVPTFRGAGGLWEGHRIEEVASPEAFRRDPATVWRFYSERRRKTRSVRPNAGHEALVALERRLGEHSLLVTQNVDELHRRAGSTRLLEIHGRLFQSRCAACAREPFDDDWTDDAGALRTCELCNRALLRPHIVWFGEFLDPAHLETIHDFVARASGHRFVFLAAGTSGAVHPAAGLVDLAASAGAETWLVNAEAADNAGKFDRFLRAASGVALPALLADG